MRKYSVSTLLENKLPIGKFCKDCYYFFQCELMFKCKKYSKLCEWKPKRFTNKTKQLNYDSLLHDGFKEVKDI